ncbi:hypothetical protein CM19_10585 [Candidatus Acidianus copahuensis]|uniref:PFL family protein n=1 Tax=Candidatus Acidianus copahuensis TaxID=1160895 RepID=A0A031LMV9_9CREN|nr:DUF711 family protein [Candidatus Acidianus copahuensis]EZQ02245.1 hypothetical protein CM19_10585 [Candidatus Acidianus copahuensis]
MRFSAEEIQEVVRMLNEEDLDIRSVTLSINTLYALSDDERKVINKLKDLDKTFTSFAEAVDKVSERLGVRIVTKRIAVSPVQIFLETVNNGVEIAKVLDELAENSGIDYVSGYSAFAERGIGRGSKRLIESLSEAIGSTKRITGMINAASTMSGVNADAVKEFVRQVFSMNPTSSSRVSIMANAPPDSPFVPSAHHGEGMPNLMINVAVSGPGVIESALRRNSPRTFREIHEIIKASAFKITRLGELIGKKVAEQMGVNFGVVDLSLAPSPKQGDSVAAIIEAMGVKMGSHGSLAALAILMDAVKKGGAMATSSIGGLSSAFIPVSEDSIMAQRAEEGYVDLFTLIALSSVCNSGVDMVGLSKSQGEEKAIGLVLDVLTLGITIDKILGVRIIPVDSPPGSTVELGGLLGKVVIMKLKDADTKIADFTGFIPNSIKRIDMG